jgi:hypothetical protein
MIMPGEKIQPKVLRQFSRMSQPSLTDVSLSFKSAEAEISRSLPPLFEGDSYSLLNKLDSVKAGANVTFKGSYMEKQHSWDAKLVDAGSDNTIPILWAQSRIEHLKTMGVGGSNQRGRQLQKIKNEITNLGLRYNLLTDYSSFVAVEKRADEEKQIDQPEYRRVPVMMTRDWHGTASHPFQRFSYCKAVPLGDFIEKKLEPFTYTFSKPPKIRKHSMTTREIMHPQRVLSDYRMEPSPPDAKKAERLWYLELLKTQQADGSFTGFKILSSHLGIPLKKLKDFSAEMDGITSKLQERALTTWLSVTTLSMDDEVTGVAHRAIKKAKSWLSQHNAEHLTVKGVPIEEVIKERFGISLSP